MMGIRQLLVSLASSRYDARYLVFLTAAAAAAAAAAPPI